MYFRKVSSLRSPRYPWKTTYLMHDCKHSMRPASCQNLRLSLPTGSSDFSDCKRNRLLLDIRKASQEARQQLGFIADFKTHLQGQYIDAWDDGSWARLCPSLDDGVAVLQDMYSWPQVSQQL
ncbi:hypothetical protein EE612_003865 [Oryza sativa]|nr:hypothetical protein EE612_003865 [Oryza sativa]